MSTWIIEEIYIEKTPFCLTQILEQAHSRTTRNKNATEQWLSLTKKKNKTKKNNTLQAVNNT